MKNRAAFLLLTAFIVLPSCGKKVSNQAYIDEPFGFSEARDLALPIGSMTSGTRVETVLQLRRDAPQIAKLYLDAVTRFDGIYGDGVGPAKRKPDFLECKAAFQEVVTQIGTLAPGTDDAELTSLWGQLKRCRSIAQQWSGPAEIATFGNDLRAMTSGSMLVLSYAATAAGSEKGPKLYSELLSLERNASARD